MTATKLLALCGVCLMLAAGQIFLKLTAREISLSPNKFPIEIVSSSNFWLALILYGSATVAWVWLLTTLPLVRIYPFMLASFALVPVLAFFFLGETLSGRSVLGFVLILAGLGLGTFGR